MLIELQPEEVEKILKAINDVDDYSSEWDDLYSKIYEQYNPEYQRGNYDEFNR